MQTIKNLLSTKTGKLSFFGGAIAGLILLCLVCSVCGLLPGSGGNQTDVAEIATLPPLDTPSPTDTLIPPIQTPTEVPPDPTATPEPSIEGASIYQDYFNTVADQGQAIGDAMSELGNLMTDPKIGVDDWTIDVAVQMAAIQVAHDTISGLEVPPGLEGFHEFLTDATGDCSESTKHLATALDTLDENELNLSASFIQSCNGKLEDLTKRMNEAIEQLE